jgi:hypothetical protein
MHLALDANQLRDSMRLWREAISLQWRSDASKCPRNLERFSRTLDGWLSLLKACDVPAAERPLFDALLAQIRESQDWAAEAGVALSLMVDVRSSVPAHSEAGLKTGVRGR